LFRVPESVRSRKRRKPKETMIRSRKEIRSIFTESFLGDEERKECPYEGDLALASHPPSSFVQSFQKERRKSDE
jgi:hypothetical protein